MIKVLIEAFKTAKNDSKEEVSDVITRLIQESPEIHSLFSRLILPTRFFGLKKLLLPLDTADFVNEGLLLVDVHKRFVLSCSFERRWISL